MPVSLLITGYYRHPKMMLANSISGDERAEVLWARALDYCNEHGTDGFVPTGMPAMLCPTKTTARVKGLVTAGLWTPVEHGWQVHDFTEWNRPAAELIAKAEAKRTAKQRAGRKGAAVRWGGRLPAADAHHTDGSTYGTTDGKAIAEPWQSDSPGPGPGPTTRPTDEVVTPHGDVDLGRDVDVPHASRATR